MRALALAALLLLGGCVSDYPYQDPYGNYGYGGYQQPYNQQPYNQQYGGYYGRDRRDWDGDRDWRRNENGYGYYEQDRWQGPPKENFAACAGMPTDHQKNGEWEYWIYAPQQPRYSYGYDNSRGYCEALVTIRKGRVLDIDYRDGRGRMLSRSAHCAPSLEACLR